MPSPVSSQPQTSSTSNVLVAAPVSQAVIGGWGNDVGYLHCTQVQPIISQLIPAAALASGQIRVAYNRSPGVSTIRVDIKLRRGTAIGSRVTMSVSVSAGSIALIGDGYLNGTIEIDCGNPVLRAGQRVTGYFNVESVTAGTGCELIIDWAEVSASGSQGLAFIQVTECPKADTNPQADASATGEMGIDASWPIAGNPIFDGTTTTKNGLVRVVGQLDRARKDIHQHLQISTPEDDSTAWPVTSAVAADIPFGTHDLDFALRGRTRKLYPGTLNVWIAHIRYKHSAGGITGNVYFKVTPIGGATVTYTIALTNSTTWATATGAFSLPVAGTGQEYDLAFQSDTTGGTQRLALLGGYENEA